MRKLQALDCKTISLETEEYLRCPRLTKKSVKSSELWLPFSLEALVARVASPDNVVVLSVAGDSYRAMLMSWVCSLRRLNISNYLVYALDDELYQHAVSQVKWDSSTPQLLCSINSCHYCRFCTFVCLGHIQAVDTPYLPYYFLFNGMRSSVKQVLFRPCGPVTAAGGWGRWMWPKIVVGRNLLWPTTIIGRR